MKNRATPKLVKINTTLAFYLRKYSTYVHLHAANSYDDAPLASKKRGFEEAPLYHPGPRPSDTMDSFFSFSITLRKCKIW